MIKKYLQLILFCSFAVSAQASTCYTMKEAEAEQGIRIASELMVIGLNCQHIYKVGNQNLYSAYQEFMNRHSKLFASYETRLLMFYEKQNKRTAEQRLNTLRTEFANRISTDAADMRPDIFCSQYAPRIQMVSDVDERYIREWARTFYNSHPVSRPMCQYERLQALNNK